MTVNDFQAIYLAHKHFWSVRVQIISSICCLSFQRSCLMYTWSGSGTRCHCCRHSRKQSLLQPHGEDKAGFPAFPPPLSYSWNGRFDVLLKDWIPAALLHQNPLETQLKKLNRVPKEFDHPQMWVTKVF